MAARLLVFVAFVSPAFAATAFAQAPLGLFDAWVAARDHDAQFRAARHELEAGLLSEPIGRAGLLPNIAISASTARVDGDRTVPTPTGSADLPLDYASRQATLQLRQPLYNREAMARYRIGSAQADQARALFVAAERELARRVADAYFEVLLSREVVALAEAQLAAYEEQVKVTTRRLSGGEGTRTEMADAQARASLAQAELIAARDRLAVAEQALATIVGRPAASLATIGDDWTPPDTPPAAIERWLDDARSYNAQIRAQTIAVEVASHEVERVRSGHYPRVDLVGSVSDSKSETVNTLDQRIRQNLIGLQLNMPLYAGGLVNAQTEQAVANRLREQAELEAVTERVLLDARTQYLAVTSALARIRAYRTAVESAQTMQRGIELGIRAGMYIASEALDATRLLFIARRDLAAARYEYLLARLKLRIAAGVDLAAGLELTPLR
ncbi:MAG TPA: TolC family outer membrane protein [Zeimonas sp.]